LGTPAGTGKPYRRAVAVKKNGCDVRIEHSWVLLGDLERSEALNACGLGHQRTTTRRAF
jgi:hypothetical protein